MSSDEGGLIKEIVLGLVLPLVKLCRTYEYTVKAVADDGRMDLAPTKSKVAPKLSGVPQWGPSGTRARPRLGSTVAVAFLDGDPGRPVVCAFVPLSTEVGQPARIDIDADDIRLGDPATRGVARLDDTTVDLLPPATFTGLIGGATATGMVVWAGQGMGAINTASAKVKAE